MTLTSSKPNFACVLTLLIGLAGCAASPQQPGTERYFTWVDEQGVLRHSPIHEPENELLRLTEQQAPHQAEKLPQADAKVQAEAEADAQSESPQTAVESADGAAAGEGAKLEALASGDAQSDSLPKSAPSPLSGASPQDDYSIDSYVDAAELQRNGFVRESDGAPFYVWTDINGVVHSSPLPARASVETSSVPADAPKISPFLHEERISKVAPPQPREMDEFARKLLKLDEPGEGMLAMLAADCCTWLSAAEAGELDLEEGYLIKFAEGQEQHRFVTGPSAYQLVRLPAKRTGYMLRLRSFVKPDVLYPALVMLDKNLKPVRLVRHALYEFEPENWFRYSYLEGWINIEPQQGDAYLLVMTVAEDMKTGTLVEHKKKTRELRHAQTGLLHLALP